MTPQDGWKQEADDLDSVLRLIGLDPQACRTDGGSLNIGRVRAALAARTTPPPAPVLLSDAWQPIETAPKDAIVLLGLPAVGALRDPSARRVYEGRWHEQQETWTSVNGFIVLTGATHWQPLPPPPIEQAIGRASREASK